MKSSRARKDPEIVRRQFAAGGSFLFAATAKLPRLVEIRLDQIRPNPSQPRKVFDDGSIAELAASIERHGLIQPVAVRRIADEDDSYLLVAGERRLRAVRLLGRAAILAVITDGDADEIGLIENLQRQDLKPVDEADGVFRLMSQHGYTQEHVAKILGKGRPTISDLVQIAKLPEGIKEECRCLDVVKSALLEIARITDPARQMSAWRKLKEGRSLRAAREARSGVAGARGTEPTVGKTLQVGRKFVRWLENIEPNDLQQDQQQRKELLRLKAKLDELLPRVLGEDTT
jgi:ParB family chromosome partitioning protein